MTTEKLNGTEDRLYSLVAPLILNPKVLRENRGVAFKTTEKHTWIVAIENESCIGFLPIQDKANFLEINNYYVQHKDKEVFRTLLQEAINLSSKSKKHIEIILQKQDKELIKGLRFSIKRKFVNYVRMKR